MKKFSALFAFLIIVGICIPAVSAVTFSENDYTHWSETTATGSKQGLNQNIDTLQFKDIGSYSNLQGVALIYKSVVNTNKESDSAPFIAKIGSTEIGRGVITYNNNYNANGVRVNTVIGLTFDSWDTKTYLGTKQVVLDIDRTNGFVLQAGLPSDRTVYTVTPSSNPEAVQFVTAGGWGALAGSYSAYGGYTWECTVDYNDNGIVNIDRMGYASFVTVYQTGHPETPYYSKNSVESLEVNCFMAPEVTVDITSPYGKQYSHTFQLRGEPGDPGDPDESGITVYIKNSQTGALIANANVVIDALVDGEYYPVTNRTEPSGIFTITLQPTGGGQPNPDGYRLIVTADGYNNPMPEINFTLGDYRKYFECFLDPIAGGPVNENKTFIDFFVRDMSSNPISGATVKFGKYTLITNSAGYTVFEVDKNNNYTWTISKSGYGPLTGNAVIGDSPRHTINTVLAPIVTPTTTTPIPTSPPIGPTPTMTAPTGEHVSNWLEWFAAHFGMILGGGVEIGKIFMWLCFTVPVGVYVGKEAKAGAAGFMAGAGIVTLFFVLIGWVPIWLVVLLALIIGLLYAKVFNAQDNGGGGR
jgi:hypothetical protein